MPLPHPYPAQSQHVFWKVELLLWRKIGSLSWGVAVGRGQGKMVCDHNRSQKAVRINMNIHWELRPRWKPLRQMSHHSHSLVLELLFGPQPMAPSKNRWCKEQWIYMTALHSPQQLYNGHAQYLMGDLQQQGTRKDTIFSRTHQCLRATLPWSARDKWPMCTTTFKWESWSSCPRIHPPQSNARPLAWPASDCEEHATHSQATKKRPQASVGEETFLYPS